MKLVNGKILGLSGLALLMITSMAPETMAQGEDPRNILAAKVRGQGHICTKPLKAERDPQLSAPDVPAWILTCDDGVFRIIVHADMADRITKLQ
ncbi:hypothetical protein ACO2I3_16805 [Leptospira interrogans]